MRYYGTPWYGWLWWACRGIPPWAAWRYLRRHGVYLDRWLRAEGRMTLHALRAAPRARQGR